MCVLLALPSLAQPGYRYGYNPRVQTVGRHGNEYVAWHRYYFGLRVGMNASHVNSDTPLLDAGGVKTGLNIGVAAGTQLTYRAPIFFETGLYYTQKGGKSDDVTCNLNYLEVPLLIKYKHFIGNQTSPLPADSCRWAPTARSRTTERGRPPARLTTGTSTALTAVSR